jgi:hypothetical protein
LKPEAEEETKTDVSYDIEKVKIIVLHFLRITIWSRHQLKSETVAYFEEIGLKEQMKYLIDNYRIISMYKFSR